MDFFGRLIWVFKSLSSPMIVSLVTILYSREYRILTLCAGPFSLLSFRVEYHLKLHTQGRGRILTDFDQDVRP